MYVTYSLIQHNINICDCKERYLLYIYKEIEFENPLGAFFTGRIIGKYQNILIKEGTILPIVGR